VAGGGEEMKRSLAALLGVLLMAPGVQAGEAVPYREYLQLNNANSSKLSIGMTKAQVLSTMGDTTSEVRDGPLSNPWKVEAFARGSDKSEILYYLVRRHPPFTGIRESQAIAIVLKNGALVAWGRDARAAYK
jgi:hypothetical protein